ncbi:uncharacterized protein Dwil_GK18905 [Drosophila willistoni]|uniref:Uncharacterized protein n=1 Tax=Drosophila willistoni TaxID=7260 RepID=B4MYT5_DROWI|nr:uncharacterized protein LOC6643549 [Drosophila willistoni]EDW77274.1 uncharacterized protein Dwil_GK18905 [Drosophila willistoni]
MDTEAQMKKSAAAGSSGGQDEVDFTSGFETQYQKEYSSIRPNIYIPPPDKNFAWYRNCSTIGMVLFLATTFLIGSILLLIQITNASALLILIIICVYVAIAVMMIWLEVQSIKVR